MNATTSPAPLPRRSPAPVALPARTVARLHRAARSDSWRTLTDAAVADLSVRGLFDSDAWRLTPAGTAALSALSH